MRRKTMFGLAVAAVLVTAAAAKAENYVVALPTDYPGERTAIETLLSKAFLATGPGDSLSVYDAPDRRRLASIAVPDDEAYGNARLKQNTFAGELRGLAPFLEGLERPAPLPANIFFPQFLREFASSALPALPGGTAELLVVGSAKYHDDREPQFTMLEGHFPSDGFLSADDNASPYGASNRRGSLTGVNVHFCTTDDDWVDDVQRQRVERFWSLYVRELGGKLATFTPDLGVCTQRFVEKVTSTPEEFVLDPGQTKPEMLRVVRSAERSDEGGREAIRVDGAGFMNDGVAISTQVPERTVGPSKLGIRWTCGSCDIDLYARASPEADFLYFARQVTEEGRHNKDWRNSPDAEDQYEYIDFPGSIDIRDLEIFVHFFGGWQEGGVDGAIRLWFDGEVFEKSFHLAAERGNRHPERRPDRVDLGREWVKVDAAELVGLGKQLSADG